MSTENEQQAETAAGNEQATARQETAAVTTTELPFDPESVKAALEKSKAGEKVLGSQEETKEGKTEEQAEETSGQEQTETETEVEQEQTAGNEEGKTEETKSLPNRISTAQFDDVEKEAIKLKKELKDAGEPVTLREAIDLVEARRQRAAEHKEQTQETTETEAEVSPKITALTAQIEDAKSQIEALRTEKKGLVEGGQLYGPELENLDNQISDLVARKAGLETRLEIATEGEQEKQQNQQQTLQQKHIAARAEVRDAMVKKYPTAADDTTPLGKRVAELSEELKNPAHPDHPFLYGKNSPKFVVELAVEQVATQIAKEKGITFEQALASLKAPSNPESKPQPNSSGKKQVVNPAPGAQTRTPAATPKAAKDILAEAGFDPQKLAAARKQLLPDSGKQFVLR